MVEPRGVERTETQEAVGAFIWRVRHYLDRLERTLDDLRRDRSSPTFPPIDLPRWRASDEEPEELSALFGELPEPGGDRGPVGASLLEHGLARSVRILRGRFDLSRVPSEDSPAAKVLVAYAALQAALDAVVARSQLREPVLRAAAAIATETAEWLRARPAEEGLSRCALACEQASALCSAAVAPPAPAVTLP